MGKFWQGLWQAPDQNDEYYRRWIVDVQGFNGAVIGYIEGIIVLGALEFAVSQTANAALWAMYVIAYIAILALSSTYAKAALVMLLNRARLSGRHRTIGLKVIGITATIFNFGLIYALSSAVGTVIDVGLAN